MAAVRQAVVRWMHNLDYWQLSKGGHKYVREERYGKAAV
jgi:hypothetical protein